MVLTWICSISDVNHLILGLPKIFFKEVKTRTRNKNYGIIPYGYLTYGDLIQHKKAEGQCVTTKLSYP